MSNSQLGSYFTITRSGRKVGPKSSKEIPQTVVAKPQLISAHDRFKDLASSTKPQSAPVTPKRRGRSKKEPLTNPPASSLSITKYFVPLEEKPVPELRSTQKQKADSAPILSPAKIPRTRHVSVVQIEPEEKTVSIPEKALSPIKLNEIVVEQPVIEEEKKKLVSPQPKPRKKKLITEKESAALLEKIKKKAEQKAAYQRFAHLAKPDQTESENKAPEVEIAAPATPKFTPNKSLPLPFHYANLYELFQSCETVVSMLHNRNEVCSFDRIKPSVEKIVRKNFDEEHVDQIVSIYPNCYSLRYDKQLDTVTKKQTGNYTLVLTPKLRDDSTKIGIESPSKGHLVFNGTRLLQRKQEFHRRLMFSVYAAHRQFLFSLGLTPEDLPPDCNLKRWHPKFPLDSVKVEISASKLPMSPAKLERRLTSAKEAVQVFKARALFRYAAVVDDIAKSSEQDKPCSSQQSSMMTLLDSLDNPASSVKMILPVLAPSPVKQSKTSNLVGISETLLAKVRAKEKERRLLAMTRAPISADRDALLSRLPAMTPQLWCILRAQNGKPVSLSIVAKQLSSSSKSGTLGMDATVEHIKVLLELAPPGWCELLPWKIPHLRLLKSDMPMREVLDTLNQNIQAERSPK
ncbi:replication licensing factor Cdt1 [Cichlidogyrus casuarinus]|uniref:Replication licensing factor Cdt1 n=1 Tax=Cichlidogyrus casuarinus TaxID=1844966 RepID=A0ABD2Q084_9PLAT